VAIAPRLGHVLGVTRVAKGPIVAYLGGNGHSSWRLDPARRALAALQGSGEVGPMRIEEAAYPGFEGRPRARDLDAFLEAIAAPLRHVSLAVGTGIGGLLALCLRGRGELAGVPLVLHAPVLWGLERRWMPRLVRIGPTRRLLAPLFRADWYQRRFVDKQFLRGLADEERAAFFDGYARCAAFPDFFDWLRPGLLRDLEQRFAERPEQLDGIRVWWGGKDRVVDTGELAITEEALARRFELTVFPEWGHYPMIEEPEAFVRALAAVLRG
jgi:pimeloyl-ACP methyl ester carboxylesterase